MQRVAGIAEPDHRDAEMGAVGLIAHGGSAAARLEHGGHAGTWMRRGAVGAKTSAIIARSVRVRGECGGVGHPVAAAERRRESSVSCNTT